MGQTSQKPQTSTCTAPVDNAHTENEASSLGLKPVGGAYFERELAELHEMAMAGSVQQHGKVIFRSGATYDGKWRGCIREGFGKQRWPDGAMFIGQWKDNKAEGMGRFMHANGDIYVGQWMSNVAHGAGIYYRVDLTKYVGEWANDRQ